MRVTKKLLLGLACTGLCFGLVAGCSDHDNNWNSTSDMNNEFRLGTMNLYGVDSGIVLVSNSQSSERWQDDVVLTSNRKPHASGEATETPTVEPTEEPSNDDVDDKVVEAKEVGDSEESVGYPADPHGLTHRLIEKTRGIVESKAVAAKVAAKNEGIKINTLFTDTAVGGDIEANVTHNLNGGVVVRKFRRLTSDGEASASIVFAELNDNGEPCIDHDRALAIDGMFGTVNEFDSDGTPIKTRVNDNFGKEWSPGRDGTEKIILLVCYRETIGKNAYGYFYPGDAFTKDEVADSNEGEILYLNANCSDFDLFSTMAHEFQHMCDFNQKACLNGKFSGEYEDTVFNEGKSVLAEDLCGFDLEAGAPVEENNSYIFNVAKTYLSNPGAVNLTSFNNAMGEYGQAYLLMRYIADRYGVDKVTEIATSPRVGMDNIAGVLGVEFAELYRDFGITNAISNLTNAPSKYNYKAIDLNTSYAYQVVGKLSPSDGPLGQAYPIEVEESPYTGKMKSWSNNYYLFRYDNVEENVVLNVKAPEDTSFVHALLIGPIGASEGVNVVKRIMPE